MANFNWGTGEQRQNILENKETKNVLGNTGTKRSVREGKKDVKGTHLAIFPLHNIFVSKSVCMELRQWFNWGIIMLWGNLAMD